MLTMVLVCYKHKTKAGRYCVPAQIAQADAMICTLDEGQGLKNLKKNSVQSFKDVFNNGRNTGEIRMDTDLGVYASESAVA